MATKLYVALVQEDDNRPRVLVGSRNLTSAMMEAQGHIETLRAESLAEHGTQCYVHQPNPEELVWTLVDDHGGCVAYTLVQETWLD